MSAPVSNERPNTSQGSSRRRRPNGKVNATVTNEPVEVEENTENRPEYRPRRRNPPRPRVETKPITDDYLGKQLNGTVCEMIKVGAPARIAFGFINLGDNIDASEEIPRVYFKRSSYSDEVYFLPRRGYKVSFTINKDADGRYFAENVRLTEKGKEEAAISKAEADSKKAARIAAAGDANGNGNGEADNSKPRNSARKQRKPKVYDDRVVSFKFTCEGKDEVKDVDVKIGLSLGVLKKELIALFDAPNDYVITYVNDEGKDELLKGIVLKNLPQGSTLKFQKSLTEA